MKKLTVPALLVVLLLSVASIRCSSGASLLKAGSPFLSSLGGVPNLSKVTSLMQTPGLSNLLKGSMKKPFTLLAPTDDALNSLGSSALNGLSDPANVNQLANLLNDHIVPGKLDAGGLMQSGVKSASGKTLNVGDAANLGTMISGDKYNIVPVNKVLGG